MMAASASAFAPDAELTLLTKRALGGTSSSFFSCAKKPHYIVENGRRGHNCHTEKPERLNLRLKRLPIAWGSSKSIEPRFVTKWVLWQPALRFIGQERDVLEMGEHVAFVDVPTGEGVSSCDESARRRLTIVW
jgi:hypothetical protein